MSSDDLYNSEVKNNLLIRTEGADHWNYEMETTEKMVLGNQCHTERPQREVALDLKETGNHVEMPRHKVWALPMNFCCKCDKNDITYGFGIDGTRRAPSPGLWPVREPMPGLDVIVDDVIAYFVCPTCAYESAWGMGNPGVLVGLDGAPLQDPNAIYWKRISDYLYAMKLRGESPKEIASV